MRVFDNISLNSSYSEKCLRQSSRWNKSTHFMFINIFPKIASFWDNVEKYCTARRAADGNTIECKRYACWIIKHTLRIYNNYCFSTTTIVRRKPFNVKFYMYIACLVSGYRWYVPITDNSLLWTIAVGLWVLHRYWGSGRGHSPTSNSNVRNECRLNPTFLITFHGGCRCRFTFVTSSAGTQK